MTIQELEIERIERMIHVLSIDRTVKYSARQREQDKEIVRQLELNWPNSNKIQKN